MEIDDHIKMFPSPLNIFDRFLEQNRKKQPYNVEAWLLYNFYWYLVSTENIIPYISENETANITSLTLEEVKGARRLLIEMGLISKWCGAGFPIKGRE